VTERSAAPEARPAADPGVAIGVAAAAALFLTYVLAVMTRAGQVLDSHAMALTAQYLAGADWTRGLLELISPWTVVLAVAVLGSLAWLLAGAVAAVAATATAVGTVLGAAALKAMLIRSALVDEAANSLPSGHVAAVAGLAAGAALAADRSARHLVVLAGLAAVAVTGVATSALGWHRPSDVLASSLLAVLVAASVRPWLERVRHVRRCAGRPYEGEP
jgi:membrane-associated phospholipid phosphatase